MALSSFMVPTLPLDNVTILPYREYQINVLIRWEKSNQELTLVSFRVKLGSTCNVVKIQTLTVIPTKIAVAVVQGGGGGGGKLCHMVFKADHVCTFIDIDLA